MTRLRYLLARLRGCTGSYYAHSGIRHDGPTCPVHEK